MVLKRYYYFKRSILTLLAELIMPIVFLSIGIFMRNFSYYRLSRTLEFTDSFYPDK
jgi:hypothetical protein